MKIGLLGFGNVGQSVIKIVNENSTLLADRTGTTIDVKRIFVRNPKKYAGIKLENTQFTTNANDILNDPQIDIVVEVMGGEYPAFDYICTALKNKKYVVTANKEVLAKHKKTFFKLAKDNGVDIYFEGAVAGGIPIIRSLKIGFAANRIDKLFGILNGTTNYILTQIDQTKEPFDVVLKKAQSLGLAEANPTMDIEGIDAAYKLVILAAVGFKADIQLSDVPHIGITHVTLADIEAANRLGYAIKLLATGERYADNTMSFQVTPTFVSKKHQLATIKNELNAVYVVGNFVGEAMLSGKGAGGSPTASAVISDIIDIAFDHEKYSRRRNLETKLEKASLRPLSQTVSGFLVRIKVADQPHAMEKISGTFSDFDISIAKLFQDDTDNNEAEIIVVTHPTTLQTFEDALAEIQELSEVLSISSKYPVLS